MKDKINQPIAQVEFVAGLVNCEHGDSSWETRKSLRNYRVHRGSSRPWELVELLGAGTYDFSTIICFH